MDIRNFFGKKPATKKPASGAASKASSESTEKKTSKATSKSEEGPPFTKRKRKVVLNDDEEQDKAVEISPQDFFASSSKTSQTKKPKSPKAQSKPKAQEETPIRKSPRKKAKRRMVVDDNDDDSDEEFVDTGFGEDENFEEPKQKTAKTLPRSPRHFSSPKAAVPSTPPISKKRKTPTSAKKKATPERKATVHLVEPGPDMEKESFDDDAIQVAECMSGITFVFTGNMTDLNRDDAVELVKTLGGRVTTAVSGKTNYLVVGPILEDGRDYKEGSKYKKAQSFDGKVKLVMGEKQLYGLCHYYHDNAMKEKGIVPKPRTTSSSSSAAAAAAAAPTPKPAPKPLPSNPYAKQPTAPASNPYAKKAPVSNPYAKKAPVNPYAKKAVNPYAKKAPSNNPYAKSNPSSSTAAAPMPKNTGSMLWVDRHKPVHTREILGNKTNVKKLQDWLRTWEKTFNNAKTANKTFSNPRGPWKAALLSGPPGIGSKSYNFIYATNGEPIFSVLYLTFVLLLNFYFRDNHRYSSCKRRRKRCLGIQCVRCTIEKGPPGHGRPDGIAGPQLWDKQQQKENQWQKARNPKTMHHYGRGRRNGCR